MFEKGYVALWLIRSAEAPIGSILYPWLRNDSRIVKVNHFQKMKFSEKELAEASNGPADLEGRLNHKRAHKSGFKEKWFKLRWNLLFYFNINDLGQIDKRQPSGVMVLENCSINLDTTTEGAFAFSISFRDEHDKRHVFSAQSESKVEQWVMILKQSSYEYWRSRLITLQERLCKKTGKDPLLMYPRNQGVVRDQAWENMPSFKSHVRNLKSTVITSSGINTLTREVNLIEF
ncbi:pleckstrin homology domain-containing family J member 1 [Neodiprion lecontei]|uniref:Pleckstrin homology domain-containing family J member 1 n=1 Tax=Neodiprion lecontei TaxID=441921 RepID=A0A6J0BQ78_NEOLC|nr:pleckstrin homology domain-containing family J member 1 [Neodiprion lecontei]